MGVKKLSHIAIPCLETQNVNIMSIYEELRAKNSQLIFLDGP